MAAQELASGLYWVGALDPEIRIFDVIMAAPHGTSYNSYLVRGEKTALVEMVKSGFEDQLLENIGQVMDPAEIDYLVLNHTEPDHSGALGRMLEACGQPQVICSKPAANFIGQMLNRDINPRIVGDGETLELGGKTLEFISAPFLHWPDTMFTYVRENRALLPCDFLGAHHSDERLFNDLVGDYSHQFEYYFNVIMRPFKEHALKALGKLDGLEISLVGPSHGPVLRSGIPEYLEKYRCWASAPGPNTPKKLLIFYASSYGNTQAMAEQIAAGAEQAGLAVALWDLKGTDVSSYIADFEAAEGIAVGSLTLNGDAVKPVWDLLSSLATLKLRGKVGAAFGSYCWSGEAPQMIHDRLKSLKFKMAADPLRVQFVPTEDDLSQCRELGKQIAEAMKV